MTLTASSRDTSIGCITLHCSSEFIHALILPCEASPAPPPAMGSIAEQAFLQIEEYLHGVRTDFSLPLFFPQNSEFFTRILRSIAGIPYAQTTTYASLGPARAVGRVCACNPLPLLIPCHRVIPAIHPPGHYRGGAALKQLLLNLEKSHAPA